MEENKVAADSSAPNSPEMTRLSGEQAEERTAMEGRKSKPGYENLYWCYAADFGEHEVDCPNMNIERTKMKAQLIVEITPDGIVVTGCENIPVPNYSVEQQAMNPILGVGYAGRSIDEAFRFIMQIAEKVCHE